MASKDKPSFFEIVEKDAVDFKKFNEEMEKMAGELGDAASIPAAPETFQELRERFLVLETHTISHCDYLDLLCKRGGFQSDRIKALENSVGGLGLLLCLICLYLLIVRLAPYVG